MACCFTMSSQKSIGSEIDSQRLLASFVAILVTTASVSEPQLSSISGIL